MLTSSKILDLILKIKGIKTDAKLAQYWKVSATTVTNWRKRNSIPFEKIITFCKDEGLSLDYIFTGKGKMIREPDKAVGNDTYIYKVKKNEDDPEITDLLTGALEVLKSKTDYSASLAANIRSFHHAIKTETRLNGMDNNMTEIKKIMGELAEKNKNIEARLRQSDRIRNNDQETQRGEILKKRAI